LRLAFRIPLLVSLLQSCGQDRVGGGRGGREGGTTEGERKRWGKSEAERGREREAEREILRLRERERERERESLRLREREREREGVRE